MNLGNTQRSTEFVLAGFLVGVLGLLYLSKKALFDDADTVDFKFIWLAGRLWNDGISPYSQDFRAAGESLFVGLNRPTHWFYPPNWWPVSATAALLPYETAGALWRAISASMIILGSYVAIKAFDRSPQAAEPWRWIIFIGLATTSSATAITLSLGQTAALTFLGVSLFIYAYLHDRRGIMTAALILLMLKPNIGIVISAALLARRFWWGSLAAASAVTLAMAAPPLISNGLIQVFQGYLTELAYFEEDPSNFPSVMTGLRHWVYLFAGVDLPALGMVGAGVVAAFLVGTRQDQDKEKKSSLLFLLISLSALFVTLHLYDAIFLFPLTLLCMRWGRVKQALVLVAALILFRTNNLAEFVYSIGIYSEGGLNGLGATLFSSAVVILIVAVCFHMLSSDSPEE